jgi:hypothetical protein
VQIGAVNDWEYVASSIADHGVALKPDGTLWVWGANNSGQLGLNLGPGETKSSPVQVGTKNDWSFIAANAAGTFAINTGGQLWAWGGNSVGELGDGTLESRSSPVQIGTNTDWQTVSAGQTTLALKTDGSLWAWSYNFDGAVGDGTTIERSSVIIFVTSLNMNITMGLSV